MIDVAAERTELLFLLNSLKERILLDTDLGMPLNYLKAGKPGDIGAHESFSRIGSVPDREREGSRRDAPEMTLEEIEAELGDCRRCHLSKTRHHIVFGEGNSHAELVFVGEAPGGDEDIQGRPFVGRAGQLLTKIVVAMGLTREEIYICNILKCRPPGNRNPLPDEIAACEPFLALQLQAIKPRVICTLGSFAAHTLLNSQAPITALRGSFHDYKGIPLMPTYHPAYLLRNPAAKKQVWEDVQKIMKMLGIKDKKV
jgi:uracil-DNA glycosylase